MKLKLLFALMTAAALVAPLTAQENETPNGRITAAVQPGGTKALEKRVTVRLKGAKLGLLLSLLSERTGLSFSLGEDLADLQVTVFIRNSPASEILELLTKSKDMEFHRSGNTDNFRVSRSTVPFAGFPPLTRKDSEDPFLQSMVNLRLKEAPLTTFLDIVSEQAKVNFVLVGEAQNIPITTVMTKTTVVDILLFLRTKGFSYSRIGGSNTFVVRALEGASDNFVKAEKAFKDAKYEEAARLYVELAEKFPDSELADYALLKAAINFDWIAARDNEPSFLRDEERLLNRLIKDYPKSPRLGDAYLYLGQIYSGYGGVKTPVDCAKAIKFYDLAVKKTYRDWVKAQASGRMAQCYELAGDKKKAADIYAEIAEKYPDTPIAKELRGRAGDGDTLLDTGAALEAQGEYKLAIEVYKRVAEKGSSPEAVRKAELRIAICHTVLKEVGKP